MDQFRSLTGDREEDQGRAALHGDREHHHGDGEKERWRQAGVSREDQGPVAGWLSLILIDEETVSHFV